MRLVQNQGMHLLAITPGRGFEPAAWSAVLHSGVDGFLLGRVDEADANRRAPCVGRPLVGAGRGALRGGGDRCNARGDVDRRTRVRGAKCMGGASSACMK